MSEDEIRAYLMRWLMEFGPGKVTATERMGNGWYCKSRTRTILHPDVVPYFETSPISAGARVTQINQAGLDFLKGGEPDE